MKQIPTDPLLQPMPLVRLRISTDLPLDPGFTVAPAPFARARGVTLVGDVDPAIFYTTDPDTLDKAAEMEANIHLVRQDAIRLFTQRDDGGDVRLRSINLDPSVLLYGVEHHPLTEHDPLASLGLLRASVAPLLADPRDACHIVPGLAGDAEPVSYWSAISIEVFLPGIPLACLHGLEHPGAGAAEGAGKTRIQLADRRRGYVIRFEKAKWDTTGSHGVQEQVDGLRVSLILSGPALATAFRRSGTLAKVKDSWRLVAFPPAGVPHVHQREMSRLEGTYLPVPPEWGDKSLGRPVTHAKVMALVSQLAAIPVGELREIDGELRQRSDSTRKRLDRDLPVETGRLKPVPVSTLFGPPVYASPVPGRLPATAGRIDPLVAAAYGGHPSAL